MARSVTLRDIVSRARIHADQRNSNFVSDDDGETLALLNEIWPELFDELCAIDQTYYLEVSAPVAVSSASTTYDLPDDFYKIVGVDFSLNGDQWTTLYPFVEGERNQAFTTSGVPSGYIRYRYLPAPQTFTALTDEVDGIAGWDRMLSLLLAIDMLDAEETNSDRLYRKYERTVKRIRETSQRDMGMPGRVTDVTIPNANLLYSALCYRLRGSQIELLSTELTSIGGPYL